MTEEQAVELLCGEIEVYVSRFRPMRNTLTGRDERTFMKMLVHVPTNKVCLAAHVCLCYTWRSGSGYYVQGLPPGGNSLELSLIAALVGAHGRLHHLPRS